MYYIFSSKIDCPVFNRVSLVGLRKYLHSLYIVILYDFIKAQVYYSDCPIIL